MHHTNMNITQSYFNYHLCLLLLICGALTCSAAPVVNVINVNEGNAMQSDHTNAPPTGALTLWYNQPATNAMNEALPIGNGRMGGLIFGGIANERIVFNEDSLWSGDENLSGGYGSMGSYQAFGDIHMTLAGADNATHYRRDLDIGNALAHVSYQANGITYRREYFVSHPDQALIVHLTADKPGAYTGALSLTDAHTAVITASGSRISSVGALANGLKYAACLTLLHQGGTVIVSGTTLEFHGCNNVTLLLGTGTSYVLDRARHYTSGVDPLPHIIQQVNVASTKSYETLKAAHRQDYHSLFSRVHLDLGQSSSEARVLPTDQRKRLAAAGNDPELEQLLFQYGRYLLISCSRPGGLPANLQGLWNDSNTPAWSSDYHTDINIQMNYWPAEVTNLSECHLPLFALVESQIPAWREATRASKEMAKPDGSLSSRGWALRMSHNIAGGMGWNWNKTANAWYCQHFWEHYAFTADKVFLRTIAYPVMKETCEYWQDHLKMLPDGRLVVPDDWSPEHGPTEDGISYSQEIIWDLFTNYLDASTALNIDSEYHEKIAGLRSKLVVPKIGRWGQLQEWMEDADDPADHHRHTSHLFGVYPGRQFTVDGTPAMIAAAKTSLLARGDDGDVREWSFAWRTALFARMAEGHNAYRQLTQLFSDRNTCTNLFGLHPPMQIDGNFGITGAIAEMLLQSQGDEITFLPALPTAWPQGTVSGLRARGGFVVDITWRNSVLRDAMVHSLNGGPCRIYSLKPITVHSSEAVSITHSSRGVFEFMTRSGGAYHVSIPAGS